MPEDSPVLLEIVLVFGAAVAVFALSDRAALRRSVSLARSIKPRLGLWTQHRRARPAPGHRHDVAKLEARRRI